MHIGLSASTRKAHHSLKSSKSHPELMQKQETGASVQRVETSATAWALALLHQTLGGRTSFAGAGAITMLILLLCVLGAVVSILVGMLRPKPGWEQQQEGFAGSSLSMAPTLSHKSAPQTQQSLRQSPMSASSLPASHFPQARPTSYPQAASPAPSGFTSLIQQDYQAYEASKRVEVPPICPSLILPHTEARFTVSMRALRTQRTAGQGSLDILGTSGRKLLSAHLCDSPDSRRCLMLASCGCEDDPRVCIFTPKSTWFQSGVRNQDASFEVFGKAGKFYGWLQPPMWGDKAMLSCDGRPVMEINMVNEAVLRMEAYTMDGNLLASAAHSDGDNWNFQAKPGSDAVLISSVMLALTLLVAP